MKFAIIAAGEGSRLSQEGAKLPKPLTLLAGTAMIERLIRIFVDNGADEIVVIVNEENVLTKNFLEELSDKIEVPFTLLVKSTQSSMHSFFELSKYLKGDKFCLTTVDTIFREKEFAKYISDFKKSESDGMMGVTDYIDDEKPLYVGTNEQMNITGFFDKNEGGCKYISGGIYCLGPKAIDVLTECMDKGVSRMRNFQRALVEHGLSLQAWPFTKIIDVDHAEDIFKAEQFIAEKN